MNSDSPPKNILRNRLSFRKKRYGDSKDEKYFNVYRHIAEAFLQRSSPFCYVLLLFSDFHVPSEYLTNVYIRDKLAPIKFNRYQEDLLFFLFYMNGGDVLQLAAAAELYV